MELNDARNIVEAILFIADQPVSLRTLEKLFDGEFTKDDLSQLLTELGQEYQNRRSPLEVREIAGGWQISTRPEFAPWIRKVFKDRLTYRLSNSAMETLSIIAYKQPITRGEIEEIRGVEVSAVLDTLVERHLVKIAGRKEAIGRPLLYGTTHDFLRSFGLKRLEDLPSVESLVPPAESEAVETAETAEEAETAETATTPEAAETVDLVEEVPVETESKN